MCETKEESLKKRIWEAKKYQKMAIRALLPKEQRKHMDIIGKEMKTVLVNGVLDVLEETGTMDRVMQYAMDYFFESERNNGADTESSKQNKDNAETESSRQTKDNQEKQSEKTESSVRKVVVG